MNLAVTLFFIGNVLATLLLGIKFVSRADRTLKVFGIGLLLNALAFAIWTFGVVVQPVSVLAYVYWGVVVFLASLIFLVYASLPTVSSTLRWFLTVLGFVVACTIFYIGLGSPNAAYISPEGLFFFNLDPLMQMLYVFALSLAAFPAIDAAASRFSFGYATLLRYGLIAEVVGGIILMTSKDILTLTLTGWFIGIVFLVLWVIFLFSRRAWQGVA